MEHGTTRKRRGNKMQNLVPFLPFYTKKARFRLSKCHSATKLPLHAEAEADVMLMPTAACS